MPKFAVLIIEDEKNIQTFVGKILKKQDYRVLYADCGKEGLNLIHSQCPDVIILDLGLPDMNGNDIIHKSGLHQYPDHCHLRTKCRKGKGSRIGSGSG